MKKVNPWFFSMIMLILIIVFTPFFGSLYEVIIGRKLSSGFNGFSHPEYFEGFFMAYAFIVPLFSILFFRTKKYKILLIFILILVLIDIILTAWGNLLINIITALVGWLLGEVILRIYKLIKKNK